MLLQLLIDHPEALPRIVRSTPAWVWGLLAGLLVLGFSQVRTRQVGLGRVVSMPLAMLGLALYGVISAFGASGHLVGVMFLWLAAYVLVAWWVSRQNVAKGTRFDADHQAFQVPGSWVPMALIVAIFMTKYGVGVELAMQPAQAHDTAFMAVVALLYGAFSGIFAGRSVRLMRLSRLAKMPLPYSSPSTSSKRSPRSTVVASGTAVSLVSIALVAGSLMGASEAQAGTGWVELPGLQGDGPVTVLYPTDAANQTINMGPLQPQLAPRAVPSKNNGRLVVISHGSGGSPWVYTEWMDQLVAAGYTVALPEHAGDNWRDHSKLGPASWALRPLEVSRAIDAVAADPRFAATLDFKRVGLWGMSAGGHTALTLAGGKWSATRLRDHCQQHITEDTATCVTDAIELNGGPLDSMKRGLALAVLRGKLADATVHSHTDPRIRAIVAGVPFAADFDLSTLATPAVPLGIVQAQADVWLKPQFHSGPLLAACQPCTLIASLPKAGHGALMGPQPPNPPDWLARLIASEPDFDRASLLPLHQNTLAFFKKHLLP